MSEVRDVVERFYGCFTGVAGGCITVTPAGAFDAEAHEASGRSFKAAIPDAGMEILGRWSPPTRST